MTRRTGSEWWPMAIESTRTLSFLPLEGVRCQRQSGHRQLVECPLQLNAAGVALAPAGHVLGVGASDGTAGAAVGLGAAVEPAATRLGSRRGQRVVLEHLGETVALLPADVLLDKYVDWCCSGHMLNSLNSSLNHGLNSTALIQLLPY